MDILNQLKMKEAAVFIAGFNRPNISYEVRLKDLYPPYEDMKARARWDTSVKG